MPQSQAGGGSGLIVRDSIGGEVLQFSTNDAIREYREIVLFRRVPEDSDFTVTLGLAGQGEAYFDDLKVEILGQSDSEASPTRGNDPLARQPSAPSPLLPAGESNDERMRR
jgi:hypothetical protein